jgi:hypothetical protein
VSLGAGSAAAAPETVDATRKVALSGRTTGYVKITLPRAASLAGIPGPGFAAVQGKGRYVGFVLYQEKAGGLRILGGKARGSALGTYVLPLQGANLGSSYALPAGDYRLYLLADGSPATVTLIFKGLGAGTVAVQPQRQVRYKLATPSPTLATPGGANFVYGGAAGRLHGQGIAFDFLRTANNNFMVSNTQMCFYEGAPPAAPIAYAPGCLNASITPVITEIAPGVGRTEGAIFGGSADLPAGVYAQGFNRMAASITEKLEYTAGFMSYD